MREFPPFQLDTINECLWRLQNDGETERIALRPKAVAVLQYLVENAGRLVNQNELLEAVWPDTYVQPEVLKRHMFSIRRALGDDPKHPRFVETVPRRGYRFIAPVRTLSAESAIAGEQSSRQLVGRDEVVNELSDRLQTAVRGQRQIVLVTGEAGIGKTTVVDAFQRQLASDGQDIRTGRGQCVEGYMGKEPYYPILSALGQLCRGPGGASIIRTLATKAPTWLVQFPEFIKREQRETLKQEILGATRERMLREACEAIDALVSETPLLLVLEDLHWVDHATVDMISALARRREQAKLMLIGTYRSTELADADHPLTQVKRDLVVHGLCEEIALDPIKESEVAEYVTAELRNPELPNGLATLIYRRSEGNPLFMVAELDDMKQRGFLSHDGETWKLTAPLEAIDVGVPESLRQIVEAQIDRLRQQEQEILELASLECAGRARFAVLPAAVIGDLDPQAFEQTCEALTRRHRLLRSTDPLTFPDGTVSGCYEFVHVLYREVCYRRISPARRAKLHLRLGEWAETHLRIPHAATWLAEQFAQGGDWLRLADHFERGGDWLRAIRYLCIAAEIAGRRCARREAIGMLDMALTLSARLPEAQRVENEIEILEKQATMWGVSFDTHARAVQTYELIAARARQHGLIEVELRALIGMTYPSHWLESNGGAEVAERAFALSAECQNPLLRAKARSTRLYMRIWAGGWNAEDFDALGAALNDLRQAAGEDRSAFALDLLGYGWLQWIAGRYRYGYDSAREGLDIALKAGEQNPYFSAAFQRGTVVLPSCLLFMGNWGEALRQTNAFMALITKNGDEYRAQVLHLWVAWVRLYAQDFHGVRAICEAILPSFNGPSRDVFSRLCLMFAGQAETGLNRYDIASEYLFRSREAIYNPAALNSWYLRLPLESAITELRLAQGDLAKAHPQANLFLEAALASGNRMWQALAWNAKARIAMTEGDLNEAKRCVDQAILTTDGVEIPLAAWQVHATAADIYNAAEDAKAAKHHLDLSQTTILTLADSLPDEEAPLRKTFLNSPIVSRILTETGPLLDHRSFGTSQR